MESIWIVAAAGVAVLLVIFLLMFGRRRERVIDMASPEATGDETPARPAKGKDPAVGGHSAGEILEVRGKDDAECGLADWLMEDANEALGIDLNCDHTAMERLAEAALKASADLKSTGRASIELPYLFADASGPKHYKRDVTREEAEVGMSFHGSLLVDELLQWRGRDERTLRLGEWLQDELDEDTRDRESINVVVVQQLADATERAMADLARSGRAVVDLPGLEIDDKPFHFRREIDRSKLDEILAEG